jgi:cytochrome c peroxidase
MANVERALASFERTLISGDSAYDRLLFRGDGDALSAAAKRGMELFFSARLACARCHAGFNLSGPIVFRGSPRAAPAFHRTSLPGAPAGIRQAGAFRAPTLRNIAVTGPYLRDGSLATLGEVVDAYASGRRGGNARGQESALLRGFSLAPGEREALIAFLEALTDAAFLSDPRFGPPMEGARR